MNEMKKETFKNKENFFIYIVLCSYLKKWKFKRTNPII